MITQQHGAEFLTSKFVQQFIVKYITIIKYIYYICRYLCAVIGSSFFLLLSQFFIDGTDGTVLTVLLDCTYYKFAIGL